jgi:energy-coupling factor transporter ATP-binding protein EcfA2
MTDVAHPDAAHGVAAAAARLAGLAIERAESLGGHGSEDAARRSRQLRDHLVGHVLPRANSLDAPLLVLIFGPTGAGKSSLLNALAGFGASEVGVLRPTTREVVVLARPGARTTLLGEGMALAALAGDRLRFIESDDVAEGVALVDSPDVDSIEHANRELTDRLAEAADLGIFVTTATRYADRVPWEVLARARDRGLPLVVVLNRMPPDASDQATVREDVARLLEEAGIKTESLDVVAIPEGALDDSIDALDRAAVAPIRERIDALGADRDARRELAARALVGSLAGLAPLAERVADDLEHEAIEADALRRFATHAFQSEAGALRERLAGGTFLRAEALRQWQTFVGADEITRFFSSGIGKIRGTISALVKGMPRAPVAEVREDTLADLVALARSHAAEAARRTATSWSEERSTRELVGEDASLWSTSPGFDAALRARLDEWIAGIAEDVQRTGKSKRLLAKGASIGVNAAGVGVMVATFAHSGGITGAELGVAAGTAFLNQKLLEAVFGEAALVEMIGHARSRLAEAIDASFADELARYERLVPEGSNLRHLADRLRQSASEVAALQPDALRDGAEPAPEPIPDEAAP